MKDINLFIRILALIFGISAVLLAFVFSPDARGDTVIGFCLMTLILLGADVAMTVWRG